MRGSKKSKRVSWASDVNLCQVRFFLSEDSPSQVGLGAQDHLQAKKSWLLHSTVGGSDDNLPPGFEGPAHSENQLKEELSRIPLIKWQCPPRFFLKPHWLVVAGQESKEVETQKRREMRVLEAVYPRPSAIPPSPVVPLESDNFAYDDRQIPLIPVTPIEDEDIPDPSLTSAAPPINNHLISQQPAMILQTSSQHNVSLFPNTHTNEKPPGVQPDVAAAASAALTAAMRSTEQGSLIDHDLLIQILNNPNLIKTLVTDYGPTPANANTQNNTIPRPRSPTNLSAPESLPLPVHVNKMASHSSSASTLSTGGHYYPVTNAMTNMLHTRPPPMPLPRGGMVQFSVTPPIVKVPLPPPLKDTNYYKSLIQQHGGESSENEDLSPPPPPPPLPQFMYNNHLQHQQQYLGGAASLNQEQSLQSSKQRELGKPKSMKPCLYFNSSRGCKRGASCAFQHVLSYQQPIMPEVSKQSAKRLKLDREITGRT